MQRSFEQGALHPALGEDGVSPSGREDRQRAEFLISVTKDAGLRALVDVSNRGLLSIAALVSTVILSTAVLVHVATRDAKSKSLLR